MIDINLSGCKGLIAAIINQAVDEATIFKHPRPPCNRGLKKKNYINIFALVISCIDLLQYHYLYKQNYIYLCIRIITSHFYVLKRPLSSTNEMLSYEARQFFNHKNKLFNHYCNLIDIDPEVFSQKVKKYFIECDNNNKKIKLINY